MARRLALPAAAVAIAAIPAVALGGTPHRVRVSVSPKSGSPNTTFVVRFRAPNRADRTNGGQYSVNVTDPKATSHTCPAGVGEAVTPVRAHERVSFTLNPSGAPGGWCRGVYNGTVQELRVAVCPPRKPCPQHIVVLGTIGRFSFTVSRPSSGGDTIPPVFAGIKSASACTPGAQRPGETTPFTLAWDAATDNVTPSGQIVYDVYESATAGGEEFSHPSWTTAPGVTTFKTPGLPSHGTFYFVVRARDQAGNEDQNRVELRGSDPCL